MPQYRLKPIREQSVVVFGASTGIGRITALRFAEQGASLTIVGRRADALGSLAADIRALGRPVQVVLADTANYDEVREAGRRAVEAHGRIDSWAHVAGVGIYGKFWDISPAEFKRLIEVNLMGQVYGAMVAIEHMRERGGALIQVSSVESQVGIPLQSAYAASKHGMKAYLDVLRAELEYDGIPISLTNIMPAAIDTPFFAHAHNKMGVEPVAPPPIYQPEEVADAIVQAAHTSARDVVVGAAGHFFIFGKRFAPWLVNMMMKGAIKQQQSDKPEPESSPSNLFAPESADHDIYGGITPESREKMKKSA